MIRNLHFENKLPAILRPLAQIVRPTRLVVVQFAFPQG